MSFNGLVDKQTWFINIMDYYSAIKKNQPFIYATAV